MSEKAKALQEVAKTTGKAIEASENLGAFAEDVFGDLLKDSVGLVADRVKYYRQTNAILLAEKLEKTKQEKGISKTKPVSPKIGIPIIENATLEDSNELHTKWANMLANAMNPDFSGTVRRSYITILNELEPIDVKILDYLAYQGLNLKLHSRFQTYYEKEFLINELKLSPNKCEISLRNLLRLGCIRAGTEELKSLVLGGSHPNAYLDTEKVGVTLLGIEFYEAVN